MGCTRGGRRKAETIEVVITTEKVKTAKQANATRRVRIETRGVGVGIQKPPGTAARRRLVKVIQSTKNRVRRMSDSTAGPARLRQDSQNTDTFADVANATATLPASIRLSPAEDEKRPRHTRHWHISVRTKALFPKKTRVSARSGNGMVIAQLTVDCFCTNSFGENFGCG